MTSHHTKDKGDVGVAKVYADLVSKGYVVLFPATEHAPFDLVAYAEPQFVRVQVKYRSARSGAIKVAFRSYWSDRSGIHERRMNKSAIDVIAVYCPDVDECFYVDPTKHGETVSLRISPARNGQQLGVLESDSFRELPESGRSSSVT
jgi:hypothetical protein